MPNTEHSSCGPQPESDSEEFTMWIWVTSASISGSATTSQW